LADDSADRDLIAQAARDAGTLALAFARAV
jgi:hypothetical protein